MTPASRLQAAIEVLQRYAATPGARLEPLLKAWARGARYAGSSDRAAVADLAHSALRRWGSARIDGKSGFEGRDAALGALRLEGVSMHALEALIENDLRGYGPSPLSAAERARLETLPGRAAQAAETAPDLPAWLKPLFAESGLDPAAESAALARRAAFDLRANTLRAGREAAAQALAMDGVETELGPYAPTALRARGVGDQARPKLRALRAYQEGLVEPQDAASQAIALLTAAFAPEGGRVLDACAGGGGKSLAIAAALPTGAAVEAYDVNAKRLRGAVERFARAGLTGDHPSDRGRARFIDQAELGRRAGGFDVVLVDAPCSGSGAWAREPDGKWRLTLERLQTLAAAQLEALTLGAAAVRPGGALLYATCSLLACENGAMVRRFLEAQPQFEPVSLAGAWGRAALDGAPPRSRAGPVSESASAEAQFTPHGNATDGFYIAALRRQGRR
ncbi:MAG: RsmB/NOP family class I SAM-dependent RNA methyltransferase [Pseudomonadota bacterium]